MNRKKYLPALVCLLATVSLLTIAMSTMTACGKSKKSSVSSVVGTYQTPQVGEKLVLKADGTYRLVQNAATGIAGTFSGTWTLKGNKITLQLNGKPSVGQVLSDGTIKDDGGDVWTKQ